MGKLFKHGGKQVNWKSIISQMEDDEMATTYSYSPLIHSNAKLSEEEKKEIIKIFDTG